MPQQTTMEEYLRMHGLDRPQAPPTPTPIYQLPPPGTLGALAQQMRPLPARPLPVQQGVLPPAMPQNNQVLEGLRQALMAAGY